LVQENSIKLTVAGPSPPLRPAAAPADRAGQARSSKAGKTTWKATQKQPAKPRLLRKILSPAIKKRKRESEANGKEQRIESETPEPLNLSAGLPLSRD
jgi:hypothetical protein